MANFIPGVGTSDKPAAVIAPNGKSVFLAWKGEGGDQGIYWTQTQQLAPDAATGKYTFNPSPQSPHVKNVATTHGPALASYQGRVYMAWKGEEGDNTIYWSFYDGAKWQPQTPLPAETDIGPAMVATDNAVFLVWKGKSDTKLWWAILGGDVNNGSKFTVIGQIKAGGNFFETTSTPALTTLGNAVFMAWRGASGVALFFAQCAGKTVSGENYQWADQQSIPQFEEMIPSATPSFGSGAGPSTTGPGLVFIKGSKNSGLFLAWVEPTSGPTPNEPSFPTVPDTICVSYLNETASTWFGRDLQDTTDGQTTLTQPTLIGVFPHNSTGNAYSPIYFFKGYGDDLNIYYNSAVVLYGGSSPQPHPGVGSGYFPPGYEPSGDGSIPILPG
jgi:hypothetical protein